MGDKDAVAPMHHHPNVAVTVAVREEHRDHARKAPGPTLEDEVPVARQGVHFGSDARQRRASSRQQPGQQGTECDLLNPQ